MTMEFRPGRYVSRYWYVGIPGRDWLCFLFRDDDGPWQMLYRFRYGEGGSGTDTRNWYGCKAQESCSEEEAAKVSDQIAEMTTVQFTSFLNEDDPPPIVVCDLVGTDNEDVIHAMLSRHPWCHIEVVPPLN